MDQFSYIPRRKRRLDKDAGVIAQRLIVDPGKGDVSDLTVLIEALRSRSERLTEGSTAHLLELTRPVSEITRQMSEEALKTARQFKLIGQLTSVDIEAASRFGLVFQLDDYFKASAQKGSDTKHMSRMVVDAIAHTVAKVLSLEKINRDLKIQKALLEERINRILNHDPNNHSWFQMYQNYDGNRNQSEEDRRAIPMQVESEWERLQDLIERIQQLAVIARQIQRLHEEIHEHYRVIGGHYEAIQTIVGNVVERIMSNPNLELFQLIETRVPVHLRSEARAAIGTYLHEEIPEAVIQSTEPSKLVVASTVAIATVAFKDLLDRAPSQQIDEASLLNIIKLSEHTSISEHQIQQQIDREPELLTLIKDKEAVEIDTRKEDIHGEMIQIEDKFEEIDAAESEIDIRKGMNESKAEEVKLENEEIDNQVEQIDKKEQSKSLQADSDPTKVMLNFGAISLDEIDFNDIEGLSSEDADATARDHLKPKF